MNSEQDISNSLYSLLDKLHGVIPINELLEPLVMLAVVKQLEPQLFEKAFKLPVVSQKNEFLTMIRSSCLLQDFEFENLQRDAFTAKMLQGLMYFVHEIESIPAFADVILNTYFSILGRHGGETITDRSLAEIIKRFSGDVSKARVFDGAAGLCSVVSQLDAGLLLLQEISRSARNVGQGLLTLKGKQFEYALGDSLISPRPSAKADMVVMQPPWRMRLQADNLNKLMGSKFIAFAKGNKLPTSASDALWVQFALFNANEAGKVILVMPHGWTFRGGYDAKLRKYLLDNDLVESITALPAGIHRHTSIPSLILVLNKNKTKKQQGVVNLIDASQLGRRERKNLRVPEAELDLIVTLMRGEPEENGLLKKVLLPVIYQNDYNLNIKEYFTEIRHLEIPDYKTEKSKLAELQKSAKEAQAKLLMMLP